MTAIPFNILSLIAEYLQWPELCCFAQVSKLFNAVAANPELYREECRREFGCDFEAFGYTSHRDIQAFSGPVLIKPILQTWKSLLKQGICLSKCWRSFEVNEVLEVGEVEILERNIREAFLRPEPPMPVLRREAKGFDTVLQDTLAYPVDEDQAAFGFGAFLDPDTEQVMDKIDCNSQTLYRQYEGRQDYIDLIRTRWNLTKSSVKNAICDSETACSSLATSGESDLAYPSRIPPFATQLLTAIKKVAKFECDYHLRELQEAQNGGEFLSEYVRRVID